MSGTGADPGPFDDIDVDEIVGNRALISVAKTWQMSAAGRMVEQSRKMDSLKRGLDKANLELSKAKVERERSLGELSVRVARLEEQLRAAETRIAEQNRSSMAAVLVAWLGALLISLGVNLLTQDSRSVLGAITVFLGLLAELAAWLIRGPRTARHRRPREAASAQPTP